MSEISGISVMDFKMLLAAQRFHISFSENRWQGVNSSRRWIYNSSILLETRIQISRIFSHLIFDGHFKVLKHLIPKHLGDYWTLWNGFTNVGSGSRSFSENRWQVVNSSRTWIYNLSILLETHLQICWIFSFLLAVLREKCGPITNFFKFVNLSLRFQGSLKIFGIPCFITQN